MRIQQGPYIGEVQKDGSYVITREGAAVEVGAASTMKQGFEVMEKSIEDRCKADRLSGKDLFLVH
jgi:hypothetical protein